MEAARGVDHLHNRIKVPIPGAVVDPGDSIPEIQLVFCHKDIKSSNFFLHEPSEKDARGHLLGHELAAKYDWKVAGRIEVKIADLDDGFLVHGGKDLVRLGKPLQYPLHFSRLAMPIDRACDLHGWRLAVAPPQQQLWTCCCRN